MDAFDALAAMPDDRLSLLDGAILIARAFQPGMDEASCRAEFKALADSLAPALKVASAGAGQARALARFLHDEKGFSGNSVDYYDPRNSFVDQVVARRMGIPISLALVYLEVGRLSGLSMEGIGFPGHFLVNMTSSGEVMLDPFSGELLDDGEIQRRFHAALGGDAQFSGEVLRAASSREILYRMLSNLKQIYLSQHELPNALACSDRMIALMPREAREYQDRAMVYHGLERWPEALADLQRFLELAPVDATAKSVRQMIGQLEQQVGLPL